MLEARGLTKRYGGLLALDQISFQLQRGEIVGYLGPNGSAAFVVFTSIGSGLIWYSRGHRIGWLVVMAILGAMVWQRRRRRARLTRHTPLLFEDTLPTEVEPLRLSAY